MADDDNSGLPRTIEVMVYGGAGVWYPTLIVPHAIVFLRPTGRDSVYELVIGAHRFEASLSPTVRGVIVTVMGRP